MGDLSRWLAVRGRDLWASAALVAVGLVTYWRGATSPALFGDEWGRASEIAFRTVACPASTNIFLRPLVGCYFTALRVLLGEHYALYRVASLLWAIVSAILLFWLLSTLVPRYRDLSLIASMLYLAYPASFGLLFLESGYYRIALSLFMTATYLWLTATKGARALRFAAATLLYWVSLLLYEAHLGLILATAVGVSLWRRQAPRRARLFGGAVFVLGVVFAAGRVYAQRANDGVFGHSMETISTSPMELASRLVLALRQLFQWAWTNALAQFVPYRQMPLLVVALAGGLLAVFVGALMLRRHTRVVRGLPLVEIDRLRLLVVTFLVGLCLAIAGYVPMIAAVHPSLSYLGSRVHIVPGIGASVALASVVCLLAGLLGGERYRVLVSACLCLPFLALGVGVHWRVQDCTAQAWADQRSMWRQMIEMAPDFAPGTVVGILVKDASTCYGGPGVLESGPWGVHGALSLLYGHDDLHGWFAVVDDNQSLPIPNSVAVEDRACQAVFLYDRAKDELALYEDVPATGASGGECIMDADPEEKTWRSIIR